MQITRNGSETAAGPAEWFTGAVYIDPVAAATSLEHVTDEEYATAPETC